MITIKETIKKWLFEPKSSDNANAYLAPLFLVGLMLALLIGAMTVVFVEGVLSGMFTIFVAAIGAVFVTAVIFILFFTFRLVLRIVVNLIINIYNYFKRGK